MLIASIPEQSECEHTITVHRWRYHRSEWILGEHQRVLLEERIERVGYAIAEYYPILDRLEENCHAAAASFG